MTGLRGFSPMPSQPLPGYDIVDNDPDVDIARAALFAKNRGNYNLAMTPSHHRIAVILGSLVALGPLSIDMYLPAFPELARDLRTDPASVQLTLAAYFVGLAIGQAFYGPLADRLGLQAPALCRAGHIQPGVGGVRACHVDRPPDRDALRPGARRLRRHGHQPRGRAQFRSTSANPRAFFDAHARHGAGADPGAGDRRLARRAPGLARHLLGAGRLRGAQSPVGPADPRREPAGLKAAAARSHDRVQDLWRAAARPPFHALRPGRRADHRRDVRLHRRLALRLHGDPRGLARGLWIDLRRECGGIRSSRPRSTAGW